MIHKKELQNNPIYTTYNNKISINKLKNKMKNVYNGKYEALIEETKEDTNIWEAIPCSWFGGIYHVKIFMQCLSKY